MHVRHFVLLDEKRDPILARLERLTSGEWDEFLLLLMKGREKRDHVSVVAASEMLKIRSGMGTPHSRRVHTAKFLLKTRERREKLLPVHYDPSAPLHHVVPLFELSALVHALSDDATKRYCAAVDRYLKEVPM